MFLRLPTYSRYSNLKYFYLHWFLELILQEPSHCTPLVSVVFICGQKLKYFCVSFIKRKGTIIKILSWWRFFKLQYVYWYWLWYQTIVNRHCLKFSFTNGYGILCLMIFENSTIIIKFWFKIKSITITDVGVITTSKNRV